MSLYAVKCASCGHDFETEESAKVQCPKCRKHLTLFPAPITKPAVDASVLVFFMPLLPPSVNDIVRQEALRGHMSPKHAKFRDDVIYLCKGKQAPALAERLDVELRVYFQERTWQTVPDVDNLPKLILDGMKLAQVFSDDRYISDLAVRRRMAPTRKEEGIRVTIRAAVDAVERIY